MIENKEHHHWLVPTLAGMAVATARRFRRREGEPVRVVATRLIAHTSTCVIAGYIAGGILEYMQLPNLVAPACAVAGMYGTILADWVEDSLVPLLNEYVKSKTKK